MSVYICSLNSGSNGNCYYVGDERDAVLIDAGLSCRETEKRMLRAGLSMSKVRAIFVSHEHSDHIRGIPVIAKKYDLPVYITQGTFSNSSFLRLELDRQYFVRLTAFAEVRIGDLCITAFPKIHDAMDPHSFIVTRGDIKIGIFTDLGRCCDNLIAYFKQCHAAFLEANYDEAMLDGGRYPWHLKQRIRGGRGHISNREALQLFLDHRPPHLSHLLLAHLSQDNNCPDLVQRLFNDHANGVHVTVASRHVESAVYCIGTDSIGAEVRKVEQLVFGF
ncbi:MBL fold metallo-hydrolase [Mucilaginibacter myungsuensis]|uniref:MBL fold metallo-hydrolase n=1 Tax=Mucilaginibacter myungsuensis TaxID=649104 RepID=A0A929L2F7_9SPHI|nr:MBL fold metallo-hydrolase [Mucilaginibacter myungsuensis]MBE9661996.1 MBL fold metallo-hydrolase [Mucilaginibacter myungsuensis]MDN3599571.1 MBL fold metallo-hydrolase [Mucilaginibacter myungsuensis]